MEKDSGKPSSSSGRQTVQVIQQALSRQPNTAAQYLQQMYAAQQQHLMLHSAQLQSLAAQQAVSRAAPTVTVSQQTPSPMATIIQRPQTVGSAVAPGISQQAVLLGNASSPALSASQAQMYLRAQMLIFTPAASVSSVPSDVGSSSQPHPISTQSRSAEAGAVNQTQLPTLAIKPTSLSLHPVSKPAGCSASHRKGDSPATEGPAPAERTTDIIPAYSPQPARPRPPLTHQPQVSQGLSSPPITSQAPLIPASDKPKSKPAPPPQRAGIGGQDGAVQGRLLPPSSAVILHIPNTRGMTPPVQENPRKTCQTHKSHEQPPTQIAADTPDTKNHDSSQTEQIAPPPLDMTSGNGSSPLPATATGSTPQNGENKPPQAVVRPQILTHVIEGFVIQEGAQPFPSHRSRAALEVGRSSLLVAAQEKCQQGLLAEKLPQQDNMTTTTPTTTTTDSELEEPSVPESKSEGDPPKLKCELCGRVDLEYKFKRSKRFCSMACAKRYNVGCTKRVGLFHPDRTKLQKPPKHTRRRTRKGSLTELNTDCMKQVSGSAPPSSPAPLSITSTLKHTNSQEGSSRCSDNSSYEEPLSPLSATSSLPRQHDTTELHPGDTLHLNHNFLPSDPTKWNVEDVYEFIRSLPGCQEISEEFRLQEIDGQALLLLKEDHLMSAMNIKLGPALKIYARISMLRDS